MKIAVLLTCYNRREKTLLCLRALRQYFQGGEIVYDVYLTDDGCTDGTAEAVMAEFPAVRVIQGSNLYWAGGMRLCWRNAIAHGGYDYYLLLNDDTCVSSTIVVDFWECHNRFGGNAVIAGTVCNSRGLRTYGGYRILHLFPYRLLRMIPSGKPESISLSGANVMFVPQCVVDRIGVFPRIYVHGIADFDYCLRAGRAGFAVVMPSHYAGVCEKDHQAPFLRALSFRERWKYLWSPKGMELKQQLYFQACFFPWRIPLVLLGVCKKLLVG